MFAEVNHVHNVIYRGRVYSGINHLVLDTSDNSIEYLTLNEYFKISDKVNKTSKFRSEFSMDKEAKLVMCANGIELFRNDILFATLVYFHNDYTDMRFWTLEFKFTGKYRVRFLFCREYDKYDLDNLLYWNYFEEDRGYYAIMLPDIYVEYLIKDKHARERELKKILSVIKFEWYDVVMGDCHVTVGIDSLNF